MPPPQQPHDPLQFSVCHPPRPPAPTNRHRRRSGTVRVRPHRLRCRPPRTPLERTSRSTFYERVSRSSHHASADAPRTFFVMNITEVDDKIIARAEQRGEDPLELARRYERELRKDIKRWNVLLPDVVSRQRTCANDDLAYVISEEEGGCGSMY